MNDRVRIRLLRDTEDFPDVEVVTRRRVNLRVVGVQLVTGEGELVVDPVTGVAGDDGVRLLAVHAVPSEAEFLRDLEVGASRVDGVVVDEGELIRWDIVCSGCNAPLARCGGGG